MIKWIDIQVTHWELCNMFGGGGTWIQAERCYYLTLVVVEIHWLTLKHEDSGGDRVTTEVCVCGLFPQHSCHFSKGTVHGQGFAMQHCWSSLSKPLGCHSKPCNHRDGTHDISPRAEAVVWLHHCSATEGLSVVLCGRARERKHLVVWEQLSIHTPFYIICLAR